MSLQNRTLRQVNCFAIIPCWLMGEVSFYLSDTCGFYVKADNDRFTSCGELGFENFTLSFGRPCQGRQVQHAFNFNACSTIIFLHSTNHIIDLWRCRLDFVNSFRYSQGKQQRERKAKNRAPPHEMKRRTYKKVGQKK